MCSEPEAVGGGVSIEKTSARSAVSSKWYVPSDSHRAPHVASSPSSDGFSGTARFGSGVGLDMVASRVVPAAERPRSPKPIG